MATPKTVSLGSAVSSIVTIGGVAEPAQSGTTFSIEDLEPETSVDITVEAISDCSCENSMVSDVCMTLPCTSIILDITNNTPDCITNLPTSIQLDVTFSGGVGGGTGSWSGDFISSDGIFEGIITLRVHNVTFLKELTDKLGKVEAISSITRTYKH